MEHVLRHGFLIGATRFHLFGQSNSQIKERQHYFVAHHLNEKGKFFASLGNFHEENVILKQESRKGQLFSSTTPISELSTNETDFSLDDIESEDKNGAKFCFSDGCGNISSTLAVEIDKKFDLVSCSAYQIRLGGIKGVLVYDKNLKGRCIQVRPSMVKFISDDRMLGVI